MKIIVSRISVTEKKYNPSQPRAPKGSPDGGQWVDDTSTAGGSASNVQFRSGTHQEDIDRLDTFGAAGGNVERLKQALAVQGYDAEVMISWTRGWSGEWSDAVTFTVLADYTKDGERVGRIVIQAVQGETGIITLEEFDPAAPFENQEFLDAVREQEISDQLKEAMPSMGWVDRLEARRTPLSPQIINDYYSERERALLTFPHGYSPDNAAHKQQREDVKTAGETALTRDGLDADLAHEIQRAWANTSNDHGSWQDVMQVEALERFSSKDAAHIQVTTGMSAVRDTRRMYPENAKEGARNIRAAYNSVYRRTQEFFKEKGLGPDDEIVLYRGVKKEDYEWGDAKAGQKIKISPRPLSSWSLSYETARGFAIPAYKQVGLVYAVKVPVKYAFAHASTGYGCLNEEEVILLGDGLVGRELEITRVRK